MRRTLIFIFLILTVLAMAFRQTEAAPRQHLSEYGFFTGNISDLKPADRVFPYQVNAPLFTDYAEKARFIYLPEGNQMRYQAEQAFEFPVGAVIIKNFYYFHNAAHPEQGRKILETRLLIREAKGWKALEYIWNDAQTDAELEVAGTTIPHSSIDLNGKKMQFDYQVPNLNQCKGCHSYDGQFTPIGITARQLNRTVETENQLLLWANQGYLSLPESFNLAQAPRLTDYRVAADTATVASARGYLDGNCAHCHNPHGPASTSGLFLGADIQHSEQLGIGKPPVAAGRGSGNRKFSIVPGKPNESILIYRMEQNDPGIRMPEIGRQLEHKEGVELLRKWIKEMK